MDKISIVIPFVAIDDELRMMTDECVRSFEGTMASEDEVILVGDSEQKGNAWSWNEGIRRSTGNIILLSDNDCKAVNWREGMLEKLKTHEVVFPVVYNEKTAQTQSHLAGEFFMFRKDTYLDIGEFDEEYGSYFEDTDWFIRAIKKGLKLGVADGTFVSHKSQGTFQKIWSKEKLQSVFDRNKKLYESKHGQSYPFLS